jgi:glutathione S-transferase
MSDTPRPSSSRERYGPAMPNLRLYVGNRNYSSWSLRPWLCLTWSGLAFDTVDVDLDQPGYGHGQIADVLAETPTGRIPALHVDDLVIWDSLAIAEWAAEAAPAAGLWPTDPGARAIARAVTAEMHAGFAPVRRDLPMNLRRRARATDLPPRPRRHADRRVVVRRARGFGGAGPYLFGARTIADAFYARSPPASAPTRSSCRPAPPRTASAARRRRRPRVGDLGRGPAGHAVQPLRRRHPPPRRVARARYFAT